MNTRLHPSWALARRIAAVSVALWHQRSPSCRLANPTLAERQSRADKGAALGCGNIARRRFRCADSGDVRELIMPRHPLLCTTRVAVALAISATVSVAHGQVYKCTDASGKTTYADAPCDSGSKPLKLPNNDQNGNAMAPNACAQLLDETHRLAADADRDAKRGRTESTRSAKHRQALTRQYEARCAGIARSEPKP